ncbi:MAG: hypothetical protein AABX82_08590 [Nanoarchaeota archaeon]
MSDIKKRLEDKLRQSGAAGALPGTAPRQIGQGSVSERAEQERQRAQYAPVDVYLLSDATSSMFPVIHTVRDGFDAIAQELFGHPERGDIRISIGYVRDHYQGVGVPMREEDFLTIHPLSADLGTLQRYIRGIRSITNADNVEGYECAWLRLAELMGAHETTAGRKQIAVFFGDELPHGFLAQYTAGEMRGTHSPRTEYSVTVPGKSPYHGLDLGCPNNVDPYKAWKALDASANLAIFVGCSEQEGMLAGGVGVDVLQRKIVDSVGPGSHSKYVSLEDRSLIPGLIMVATRLAQSNYAAQQTLAQLPDHQRRQIAGLLGVGNQ